MSDPGKALNNLTAGEKRALLEKLLKQRSKASAVTHPLSYGQQAWWFIYQMDPANAESNVVFAARVKSEVDVGWLRDAFQQLVDRHASLRTTYSFDDARPKQVVHGSQEVCFEHRDVSGWDAERTNNALIAESHRPFDLETGPVMRVGLFTSSPRDHVLILTAHHIAVDLWSITILLHELRQLHSAKKFGSKLSFEPLNSDYSHYVYWQSQMLAGAEGDRLWNFWEGVLKGELPALDLPSDRPRPPVVMTQASSFSSVLSADLNEKLKRMSRSHGATLYMTLLAAFKVLLHRYSGQQDLIVGSLAASGRGTPEFASTVGYFDNPLALRSDLSGNPRFVDFLSQVSETVISALEHQDFPFALLVERLKPARDGNRSPLFQTMFILQRAQLPEESDLLAIARGEEGASMDLGGLLLESIDLQKKMSTGLAGHLDLTLTMAECNGGLSVSLQYRTALFDGQSIARIAENFRTLLESIAADPYERILDLDIISTVEKRQLQIEWNDTARPFPDHRCLHQLFETQAEANPEATAAIFRGRLLTYGELNRSANRVAHYLLSRGVGPETMVGICVERSHEMITGLLGILKAGGAYLPLDPAYPTDRLAFMVEDAQAGLVMCQRSLIERLGPLAAAEVVCLDDLVQAGPFSDENPSEAIPSDALAYVIYTSGSTGRPKGVMIDHRSAINTLIDINDRFDVTAEDRVLALSSLSFDLSVYDVFGTLAAGAAIVIPEPSETPNPSNWADLIIRQGVTVWNSAPALMEVFLNSLPESFDAAGSALRLVMLSGDWIAVNMPDQIRAIFKRAEVVSLGGATEGSIWSILYRVGEVPPDWRSIPYGRPMYNQEFRILDTQFNSVPVGVVGSLYIGGAGVARGYLNRRELTAERFIPDPFSGNGGARLYNTGDLGRYRNDGTIEFLGRKDFQVKVRGFRIELGEIESALSQHPSVREAVVSAYGSARNDKRLVAYVVRNPEAGEGPRPAFAGPSVTVDEGSASGQRLMTDELRAFLRDRLPEYMLPSAYYFLDAIPLTPNGKVDRQALPAPEFSSHDSQKDFVHAKTATEEIVASVWAQVLKVERVSVVDNFFELGGDSLLATQCISRLRNVLAVELPLQVLFESPTVRGVAACIDRSSRETLNVDSLKISPVDRGQRLVPSFAQQRLWFVEQLAGGSPIYNVPAVMRLRGRLNVVALEKSLREIIRRHESLRTTFTTFDDEPSQVIRPSLAFELPVVGLDHLERAQRETTLKASIKEEATRTFDITEGPLFRSSLFKLAEQEYVLVLVMHHIIADGWSVGVIIQELTELYEAYRRDEPSPLSELPIQYADFAYWQRRWLSEEVLAPSLAYWKGQLAGSTFLQLPTDHPRSAEPSFNGAKQSFIYPLSLLNSLRQSSQREGVTLFMTLLAAFKVLLFQYTRKDDIVIGSPIANRNRVEVETLIGLFLNTLVLRTSLAGNPTFRELLGRVREMCVKAYMHQDLPVEKLVEELQPDRNYTHSPMFQIFFILQNAPLPTLQLSDVSLSLEEVDKGVSKFELELNMFETDQGLLATWIYNTDLFEAGTIAAMSRHLEHLMGALVANPEARLNQVEYRTAEERNREAARESERRESNLKKLLNLSPKPMTVSQKELVTFDYFDPARTLPLVIRAASDQVDLAEWLAVKKGLLEDELLKHGAILFRGFKVKSAGEFEKVAAAICPELFTEYGDLPRQSVGGKVYTSTPYPPDQAILHHNESSHMHQWPTKIWFCCLKAARHGGETPIVDCRKLYQALDPGLRDRFEKKKLLYVRNYIDGFDVDWREFFKTEDRAVVEQYCRRSGIECEWKPTGVLRTRKFSIAVATHPSVGEKVFFNQMQAHHIACVDPAARQSLLALFKEEDLPRNVYYGDGTRIEDSVMEEISGLYKELSVSFPWEEGDVMLVENMLVAHARNPFSGERNILVTMGDVVSSSDIKA